MSRHVINPALLDGYVYTFGRPWHVGHGRGEMQLPTSLIKISESYGNSYVHITTQQCSLRSVWVQAMAVGGPSTCA